MKKKSVSADPLLTQAFVRAYAQVEKCELQLRALECACSNDNYYVTDRFKDAKETIRLEIFRRKAEAYSRVFMFGAISADSEVLEAARTLAYQQFLSDQKDSSYYLDSDIRYNPATKYEYKKELHQLARAQKLRLAQISESSLLEDIRQLKHKVAELSAERDALKNDLAVIHTLKP